MNIYDDSSGVHILLLDLKNSQTAQSYFLFEQIISNILLLSNMLRNVTIIKYLLQKDFNSNATKTCDVFKIDR